LLDQNIREQELNKKHEASIISEQIDGSANMKENSEDEKYFYLGRRIEKFMIEEKPYLKEDTTLDELSKALSTNRTYLSKAIQRYFNQSFNDLICHYRVNTAKELLTNYENDHLSIESIGRMAGFKSSSAFHRRFKAQTRLTPDYYRNNSKTR